MNSKPPLTYSTLAEAIEWITLETSAEWSENELLDAAARYGVTLHAGPPLSAKAQVMEIDPEDPGALRVKYGGLGWRMAELFPIHIGQILTVGETETVHPAHPLSSDGEFPFFTEPVRVTRDQVRISAAALAAILAKRKKDMRRARYTERAAQEKPQPAADMHKASPGTATTSREEEARLSDLFDPVPVAALETMFPDGGRWKGYAERATRNGLADAARTGRAKFNPYSAAEWWLDHIGPERWDRARCNRVLANNLPDRSRDSKHLLTGNFD